MPVCVPVVFVVKKDDSNRGEIRAYGGLAAEFYRRVALEYNVSATLNASCFKGEPHMVETTFRTWLKEEGVLVLNNTWITDVMISSQHHVITAVTLSNGASMDAVAYIDASYEGDLLALAGVPVTVGREPASLYNESFGGRLLCTSYEQFEVM